MAKKKYYLTTAIPYVNAKPHIGHALEYVIADAIHRYQDLIGNDVYFVSGADENALKNVQAAEKAGVPVQQFLNENSKTFADFYKLLEVDLDEFRRGTDQKHHWPGVQKLWKLVDKNGDIYKKKYKGLYCVGCEEFKTEKDLVDGKCPDHDKVPEEVEEENYFFKLSKYQDKIFKLIESDEYKIIPSKRKNEILSFIKDGLTDISISRSNERARGVGVPVEGDNSQKAYVWFDALNIYQTAVGFGYDENLWKEWWPADLHIIGKDIIRFHAVYWPAILLSASLPLPKRLLVHGFITSGGRKMSKSIGNVIDPYKVIEKHGVETTRYFLLSQIPTLDDGDLTIDKFENVYQADLANGLGNLVSRVAGMAERADFKAPSEKSLPFSKEVVEAVEKYKLDEALSFIWYRIKRADVFINKRGVWNLNGKQKEAALTNLINRIRQIAYDLKPFLPKTAQKIEKQFKGPKIRSEKPLFPRLR
ncbi:methionine--tRNA ligase [Candidatus Woesebacteria bacterium RIFCSPHIGHO2_01_FULL_39_17]|uniref:methionine--tRNA ligase n=2 Tax=Candidatus Woeseibacteriota TaxID=1752722 RepID=A0A0G0NF58_9BACT|nr:MAG: methionyl-tRNA synthetase, methionyl-tRNA synthetase [Microgenomates group bacterium GW2011_GWC1_38_12]KKR14098.1 MAG: Methionine-tRNA ligase [Candidatus Woesebacteria bacterium GW2011_GWA1_39_21b]OGM23542.1 MAG: methionine--tRNA ligase [Candidatus Woesebacteria bacterium RIFCSPHIGHO2_01_FULL_39_17]OGM62987.1 MAG: methionine--tRNA ligase [Candidatus Woesebacteria bacterium RIFCSPLOWO2_01_FULL_39_14]